MAERLTDEPQRLRQFASELRERARCSVLPGYAEERIRDAEALEGYVTELHTRLQQSLISVSANK